MTNNADLAAQIALRNAARRDLMTTYRGATIAIATNPATGLPEIVYPESELGGAPPSFYTWHAGGYVSIPRPGRSFAPGSVTHRGSLYYATGKYGADIATGQPSAEYEDDSGRRLWLLEDGTVEPD